MNGAAHLHLPLGPANGAGPRTGLACVRRALATGPIRLGGRLADDVLLVACELLTNAYHHTPGPLCLDIDLGRCGLTVAVTDASTAPPVVRPYRPQEPHGHGMHIVDRLSESWGVTPRPSGKTVWATLPRPPEGPVDDDGGPGGAPAGP